MKYDKSKWIEHYDSGMSISQIGEMYGAGAKYVGHALRKMGYTARGKLGIQYRIQDKCSRCREVKPGEFSKSSKVLSKQSSMCRECATKDRKLYRARKNYGLDEHGLNLLRLRYPGCAICKTKFINDVFYIDHCHTTGNVRGLLCRQCNFGIGIFNDSPKLLHSAIEYLESHKGNIS